MPIYLEGMDNDYQTDGDIVYDDVTGEAIGFIEDDMIYLDNGDCDYVVDRY